MVAALRNYWWVALMLASMALSFFAYEWVMELMGYGSNAALLAGMLLISISLHEFGHWIVMQEYGLRPYMVVLVILGGAGPREAKAMDNLHRRQLATILLAGPMANFAMVVLGLFMASYTEWEAYGWSLASINAGLIAFNLLPWGPLDGGRFAKLLFDSVDEQTDRYISRSVLAIGAVIGIVLLATGHFSLYPALMTYGALRASKKDDPLAWQESRSMSTNVSWVALIAWIAVWGASVAFYVYLPMWTTQFPH